MTLYAQQQLKSQRLVVRHRGPDYPHPLYPVVGREKRWREGKTREEWRGGGSRGGVEERKGGEGRGQERGWGGERGGEKEGEKRGELEWEEEREERVSQPASQPVEQTNK